MGNNDSNGISTGKDGLSSTSTNEVSSLHKSNNSSNSHSDTTKSENKLNKSESEQTKKGLESKRNSVHLSKYLQNLQQSNKEDTSKDSFPRPESGWKTPSS